MIQNLARHPLSTSITESFSGVVTTAPHRVIILPAQIAYARVQILTAVSIAVFAANFTVPGSAIAQSTQQPSATEKTDENLQTPTNPQVTPSPKSKFKFRKHSNIYYTKTDDYSLLCDIYMPEGEGPFPAVLAIHGGAWRHGSKLHMLRHAWKLAGAGYVVVAINYRHAPEYKFPAQIHDAKNAVRWMRYKSEKLKINPEKIAVFGYSAGGHLGAMLGTTDVGADLEGPIPESLTKYSSRVACVVVGGGPCEFSWVKSNSLASWLGYNQQQNPEIYRQAAPITYVTPDDPPFMFFHGSIDKVVPPASAEKMHRKLLSVGIQSTYHRIEDHGHFATFSNTKWLDTAIEFMDRTLKIDRHE